VTENPKQTGGKWDPTYVGCYELCERIGLTEVVGLGTPGA
jgi:hypothetical protein